MQARSSSLQFVHKSNSASVMSKVLKKKCRTTCLMREGFGVFFINPFNKRRNIYMNKTLKVVSINGPEGILFSSYRFTVHVRYSNSNNLPS